MAGVYEIKKSSYALAVLFLHHHSTLQKLESFSTALWTPANTILQLPLFWWGLNACLPPKRCLRHYGDSGLVEW